MARSEEATHRRAEKRNRTIEEQRKADGEAYQQKVQPEKKRPRRHHHDENNPEQMKEPGAWICPGCGNHNFASRRLCHSKTCNERQPSDASGAVVRQQSPAEVKKNTRHNSATSKSLSWAAQADESTIQANQSLRQRYAETNGEGMTDEERERAEILITRDKRKQEKKRQRKKQADSKKETQTVTASAASGPTDAKPRNDGEKKVAVTKPPSSDKKKKVDDKETRKKNKIILKRYLETSGEGMTSEEQERAKVLVARNDRRKQKRASQEEGEKSK